MKALIVLAILLMSDGSLAEDAIQRLERQWIARGIQATERIDKLREKEIKTGKGKLSKKEYCDMTLESTFRPYAIKEGREKVLLRDERVTSFNMVIFRMPDGNQSIRMKIAYNNKTGLPVLYLAYGFAGENTSVGYAPSMEGVILIQIDNCHIKLRVEDPFTANVEVIETQK